MMRMENITMATLCVVAFAAGAQAQQQVPKQPLPSPTSPSAPPAETMNGKYIRDVTVVAGGDKSVACPSGSPVKVMQDLNEGAGGDFIYLCLLRTNDKSQGMGPLEIVNWGRNAPTAKSSDGYSLQSVCPNRIDVDLNKGTGGSFIFVCKTLAASLNAGAPKLTDIRFVTSDYVRAEYDRRCKTDETAMFTRQNSWNTSMDLNDNAGGKYIWGCMKKES
ncbi:MAG TPA: hypothetical protein VM100_01355 [Longimicrobiales bacterium]|nr:hypothetical protein [Longimicrobiales bacterium]